MKAIDVASFQSGMNTGTVDADAVIVKFTQGLSYKNPYRVSQLVGALNAGKRGGAYHYASGAGTPEQEADFFISEIRPYLGKITLWLDWETGNTAGSRNTAYTQHWAWVSRFINRVKSTTGQECGLYYSASLHNIYKDKPVRKWVAQYPDYTPTGWKTNPWNEGAYTCDIRQYTSVGRISGYNGNVDLNKVYMTPADWDKMAGGGATNTTTNRRAKMEFLVHCKDAHWGYPAGAIIYINTAFGGVHLTEAGDVTFIKERYRKEYGQEMESLESSKDAPTIGRALNCTPMSRFAIPPIAYQSLVKAALDKIPFAKSKDYEKTVSEQIENSIKTTLATMTATSETTTTLNTK